MFDGPRLLGPPALLDSVVHSPATNPNGYCPDHGTGVACPIGVGVTVAE
mgnify:FL=1